jgi:hypothetical protein
VDGVSLPGLLPASSTHLTARASNVNFASEPFSRRVHAALQLRAILRRVDAAAKRFSHLGRKQFLCPRRRGLSSEFVPT